MLRSGNGGKQTHPCFDETGKNKWSLYIRLAPDLNWTVHTVQTTHAIFKSAWIRLYLTWNVSAMASSASHSVASLVLAQKVVTKWKKIRDDKEKTSFLINDANAVSCGQSWGQNARLEIFLKQGKLKEKQERRTEKQFKKWELLKSKIASARLGDVLSGVNFYLGRKRYSVLKQLGEGPHSKVFEV